MIFFLDFLFLQVSRVCKSSLLKILNSDEQMDKIATEIVSAFDLILVRYVLWYIQYIILRLYDHPKKSLYLGSLPISNHFSDHYFESMILLKYEFGWEWEDVLYFVTNQRSNPKELSKGWFSKGGFHSRFLTVTRMVELGL